MAMLVVVALISIGLAVAGPLWSQRVRRDHERDLLRVGALYAQALADYRDQSPGSDKRYPMTLAQLLNDDRSIRATRYLRRLYPDPVAPTSEWGLIRDDRGAIEGVFSQSSDAPIAGGPQVVGALTLAPAARYSDWRFIAPPAAASTPAPSSPLAATTSTNR